MPVKSIDPTWLQWGLGIIGGVFVLMVGLMVRGFKGYLEDIKKRFEGEIKDLENELTLRVKKDYIKEEIKPELVEITSRINLLQATVAGLVSRTEHISDIRELHHKVDGKVGKNDPK